MHPSIEGNTINIESHDSFLKSKIPIRSKAVFMHSIIPSALVLFVSSIDKNFKSGFPLFKNNKYTSSSLIMLLLVLTSLRMQNNVHQLNLSVNCPFYLSQSHLKSFLLLDCFYNILLYLEYSFFSCNFNRLGKSDKGRSCLTK